MSDHHYDKLWEDFGDLENTVLKWDVSGFISPEFLPLPYQYRNKQLFITAALSLRISNLETSNSMIWI